MHAEHLKLQKPLEDYVELMAKLSPRSVSLLTSQASESYIYRDPYIHIKGAEAAQEVFRYRLSLAEDTPRMRVHDFIWGRKPLTAYLSWSYIFTPKKRLFRKCPAEAVIEGMTRVMFTPEGRVASHEEFWGAHKEFDAARYSAFTLSKNNT